MSETIAPVQVEPKTIAGNITKAISERSNGKAPATTPPINGKPPVDPSASQAPDPNAGKKKYVVEGQEVWLTPQEIDTWAQKAMGYEKKLTKMSHLQAEVAQFQKALIDNPGAVLSNLAKQNNIPLKDLVGRVLKGNSSDDVKEVVGKWYYDEAVEPSTLSPEQLEARENKRWRTEQEAKEKQSQEMQVKQENQQRFIQAQNHIKAQIAEAMKESGLPTNDTPLGAEMAWMVAKTMQLAQKQRQPLTPKQAIEMVKQTRIKPFNDNYYKHLASKDDDGAELAATLGEEVIGKIGKYLLKRAQTPAQIKQVQGSIRPTGNKGERKTINSDDFHDIIQERIRKG